MGKITHLYLKPGRFGHIFVGLGASARNIELSSDFEIVHIDTPSARCRPVPNTTRPNSNAIAGYDENTDRVHMCGGTVGPSHCHSYSRLEEFLCVIDYLGVYDRVLRN